MLSANKITADVLLHIVVGILCPSTREDIHAAHDHVLSFYSHLFTLATKLTKYMASSLEKGNYPNWSGSLHTGEMDPDLLLSSALGPWVMVWEAATRGIVVG